MKSLLHTYRVKKYLQLILSCQGSLVVNRFRQCSSVHMHNPFLMVSWQHPYVHLSLLFSLSIVLCEMLIGRKSYEWGWIVFDSRSAFGAASNALFPNTSNNLKSFHKNAAINVLCGIGLLSTPYALKQGGWWSLAILFIFGIITCFTGILLKRCLETSPRLQTYPDIGQAAFGIPGRIFLSVSLKLDISFLYQWFWFC